MELKETIAKRRSIRKFDTRKVDNKIIEEILYNGTLAPSGKNKQTWRFVVIQEDEQLKNKIADMMIQKNQEMSIEEGKDPSIERTANIIKQAPVLVVIFNNDTGKMLEVNLQSIGACIENICLSATDMGLGSLWICNTKCVSDKIEDLLGKSEMSLVACVSLGYSLEEPSARPRMPLEEITDWK